MYWDIRKILPYQRKWNFINGTREIGKTYSTLKWLIKQALEKNREFVYICRTKNEKNNGVLEYSLEKVCAREYSELELKCTKFIAELGGKRIAYCISLYEYMEIKKYSFPEVYYIVFDEYMLELNNFRKYVGGWKEPDRLLSIYQTIDRGEDRVTVFCLGNNTQFYNPYHLHEAFRIPNIEPGKIWYNKFTLFQWALPSDELTKYLNQTEFNQQMKRTEYGKMAIQGKYEDTAKYNVAPLTKNSRYQFTVACNGMEFGIYSDMDLSLVFVSQKVDPNFPYRYALTVEDHTENTLLVNSKIPHLQWFNRIFRLGIVRFENEETQAKFTEVLKYIIR